MRISIVVTDTHGLQVNCRKAQVFEMATSGVKLAGNVMEQFQKLKKRKTKGVKSSSTVQHFRYMILGFNDSNTEVIIKSEKPFETDEECSPEFIREVYEKEFQTEEDFSNENCAWGIFNFEDAIALIQWAPDSASMKKKMLCATTTKAISSSLEGILIYQANDTAEMSYDEVVAVVCKNKRP